MDGDLVKIFPEGRPDSYQTGLRGIEEIAEEGTVLQDPGVGAAMESGAGRPALISKLVMEDFMSVSKLSMFNLSQNVGFNDPNLKRITGQLFDVASDTIGLIQGLQEGKFDQDFADRVLDTASMAFLNILSGVPNLYVQVAAMITSSILTIMEAVNNGNKNEIDDSKLIPIQTADTSTDEVQVQGMVGRLEATDPDSELVVYRKYSDRDNSVAQARLQYTPFFLPRFRGGWKWEWRSINKKSAGVAFQRSTFEGEMEGSGALFEPNMFEDADCIGFMPGSQFCQSVIQTQFTNYFPTTIGDSRWSPTKYNIRSKYKDRWCRYPNKAKTKITRKKYQDGKGDYDYDCKHAVGLGSVWTDGPIYGGLHPLMMTTPSSNVGQFYSSLNKGLFNLWAQMNEPGPLMYSVDCEEMLGQWQAYFETFWLTAPVWWRKYRGWGWKGQVSSAISHMLCSRPSAWDPDDESQQNDWIIGPSTQGRTYDVFPDIQDTNPHMPWGRSIFECVIKPAVMDLARRQYQFLDTTLIAYLPPRAGAYYRWGYDNVGYRDQAGVPHANNIVSRFYENRRALLHSGKRMGVDLRLVIDREYRKALIDAGVKWPGKYSPVGIGRSIKGADSTTGVEGLVPGQKFTTAFSPTGGTPMTPVRVAMITESLSPEVKEEAEGVRKKKGGGGSAMIAMAGLAAIMMASKSKGRK